MGRVYLAVGGQTLISACTYLVAQATMKELGPLEVAWFRFVLAGVVYAALFAATARPLLPPREVMPRVLLLSIVGLVLNQGLFLSGLALSSPTHAAILYALTPAVVLIQGRLFLGERISALRAVGVAIAFVGVGLVLFEKGFRAATEALVGDLLILGAVVSWATYTVLTRPLARSSGSLQTTGWVLMAGGLISLPFGPLVLGTSWAAASLEAWLGIAFLVLVTSVIAYLLWGYALGRLEAARVAVFTNLQPVATAVLSWAILGEGITVGAAVGGLLVIVGVTATQRG